MTTIAALGWVLGALWWAPVDQAPLKVTSFYEAQKPVSDAKVRDVVDDAGKCLGVARRWAL